MKQSFHYNQHEQLQFHHFLLFIHQLKLFLLHQLVIIYQSLVHLQTYEEILHLIKNFQDVINQSKIFFTLREITSAKELSFFGKNSEFPRITRTAIKINFIFL